VLLLVPARTYRAADFILAAERMRLDLVVASDGALPLGRAVIPARSADLDASARRILARAGAVDAVVAADTPMLVLAATVAAAMGLPHNPVDAVRAATDKAAQRRCWAAAGVPQPSFRLVPAGGSVRQAAEAAGFPCVVKAVSLSASQGVLRADDTAAAVEAARRIRQILDDAERSADEPLLIEEFLPGPELSIDGVLTAGDLTVTAVFDKPGVTGLTITIPPGQRVRPLPDGDRYLGFIFASGGTPADVEQALTAASGRLRVIVSDDRPGCRPSS
jgi:biotin carboxylase